MKSKWSQTDLRTLCRCAIILFVTQASLRADIVIGPSPATPIVLADQTIAAEDTAAQELATYLGRITGGSYTVTRESNFHPSPPPATVIYIGPTTFAAQHGVDNATLGSEEWIIQKVDNNLMIIGGRMRGTIYGVYHFLEDSLGVHWWSPYEETVPTLPEIRISTLDRRGKPAFFHRELYISLSDDSYQKFAARNRLNAVGPGIIPTQYGGRASFGPPDHCHTLYYYLDPNRAQLFAQHPEWFPLIDGQRTCDLVSQSGSVRTQLCYTNNTGLRTYYLNRLKQYIQQARQSAQASGQPAPTIFSLDQPDCGDSGYCQCDNCTALKVREGSTSGLIVDFLNTIAAGIKTEYPDIYIVTLAYSSNEVAPRTLKPADNIIIRLCDTRSNYLFPTTHPDNDAFRANLINWSAIAKNMMIWDYAVTFGYGITSGMNLPCPSAFTFPLDFSYARAHGVQGYFIENEETIGSDMRDLKIWLQIKFLEDPSQNYDELLTTFTDGYYGPAAAKIRQYLSALQAAAQQGGNRIEWFPRATDFKYLTDAFVIWAQNLFDETESLISDNATLVRRVRHARLSLDRATMARYRLLQQDWVRLGQTLANFPLNLTQVADRYVNTWETQCDFRGASVVRGDGQKLADSLPGKYPLPARFSDLNAAWVYDFCPQQMKNLGIRVQELIADSTAEVQSAIKFDLTKTGPGEEASYYTLPLPWGLYDENTKVGTPATPLAASMVPGPGYQWYKVGTFKLTPSTYFYFTGSWRLQVDVGMAADETDPNQLFDIWAQMKFEGPNYPYGTAQQSPAIYVERLIVYPQKAIASTPGVILSQTWENAGGYFGDWTYTPAGPIASGAGNFGAAGYGSGPSVAGSKVFYDNSTFSSASLSFSDLAYSSYIPGMWSAGTTFTLRIDYKGGAQAGETVSPRIIYWNGSSQTASLSNFTITNNSSWKTYTKSFTYTAGANITGIRLEILIYHNTLTNNYLLDNIELKTGSSATSQTVYGTATLANYQADPSIPVVVKVELRKGGTPVRIASKTLDVLGRFTLDNVTPDTYDVAVKSYAHLQKVLHNVVISDNATNLGAFVLQSGDLDGNNQITNSDLSIILDHMDTMGVE